MTVSVVSPRRYYLLKRRTSEQMADGLEGYWRHKQEAILGSPLPTTFPLKKRLSDVGYTTVEDLTGADENELRSRGLSASDARAVLTALSTL